MDINKLKIELLNELKPIMLEAVEGWLNNQKDTLLLSLVGMIEQEKWKREHDEMDNAVQNAIRVIGEIECEGDDCDTDDKAQSSV